MGALQGDLPSHFLCSGRGSVPTVSQLRLDGPATLGHERWSPHPGLPPVACVTSGRHCHSFLTCRMGTVDPYFPTRWMKYTCVGKDLRVALAHACMQDSCYPDPPQASFRRATGRWSSSVPSNHKCDVAIRRSGVHLRKHSGAKARSRCLQSASTGEGSQRGPKQVTKEPKSGSCRETCTPRSPRVIHVSQMQKQPRCPPMDECTVWSVHSADSTQP